MNSEMNTNKGVKMADYLKENILCQSYIKVDKKFDLQNLKDQEIDTYLKEFAGVRAKFLLYNKVEVKVDFRPGSTITVITILGSLHFLYQFISEYPSFREGLNHILSDIKMLSESLKCESLIQMNSRGKKVTRTEARVGLLGSIQKIFNMFEQIENQIRNNESMKDITKKMIKLEKEILKLSRNLTDPKDKKIVKIELTKNIKQMKYPKDKKVKVTQSDISFFKIQHSQISTVIENF